VYLLRCRDGSYYCGYTGDLKQRLAAHRSGAGARYTRSRLPVRLVYREPCADRRSAMRREVEIKRMSHKRKAALASWRRSITQAI
jgi:putative endonuclease